MASRDKQADILEAGRRLALRHGLAGVTMEAIAREAHVAKPTLYKYYGDKSAVFRAIVTELLVELHGHFSAAISRPGPVSERIAAALLAKYAALEAFMEGSPHADELYGAHDRMAAAQVAVAEAESDAAVVAALREAGLEDAELVARIVIHGAYGIFRKARPDEDVASAVRLLAERMIGRLD